MKAFFYVFLFSFLVSSVMAKRQAPVDVPSVLVGDISISVPHFTEINGVSIRGGVLEAQDSKTGEVVWSLQVYETDLALSLEKDVQDVFIKTLSYDATHEILILSNEREEVFVVDLKTRAVRKIAGRGLGQAAEKQ